MKFIIAREGQSIGMNHALLMLPTNHWINVCKMLMLNMIENVAIKRILVNNRITIVDLPPRL